MSKGIPALTSLTHLSIPTQEDVNRCGCLEVRTSRPSRTMFSIRTSLPSVFKMLSKNSTFLGVFSHQRVAPGLMSALRRISRIRFVSRDALRSIFSLYAVGQNAPVSLGIAKILGRAEIIDSSRDVPERPQPPIIIGGFSNRSSILTTKAPFLTTLQFRSASYEPVLKPSDSLRRSISRKRYETYFFNSVFPPGNTVKTRK